MTIAYETVEDALYDYVQVASGLAEELVLWAEQDGPRPEGVFISMNLVDEDDYGLDWIDREHNPLELDDDVIETVTGSDLTLTGHVYLTGDGPVRLTTTGALPAPLLVATDYWLIKTGADEVQIASSRANALTGTEITLTDAGSGTNTIVDTADTRRVGQEIKLVARGPRRATLTLECLAGDPTGEGRAIAILAKVKDSLPFYADDLSAAGVSVLDFARIRSVGIENSGLFEPRALVEVTLSLSSEVSKATTNIVTVAVGAEVQDQGATVLVDGVVATVEV